MATDIQSNRTHDVQHKKADTGAVIETALKRAQLNASQGLWAMAIAECEAAIAQCQQQLAVQKAAPQVQAPPKDASPKDTEWDSAIARYQKALAVDDKDTNALSELGKAYLQKAQRLKQSGDLAGAVRLYLTALKQQPRLFAIYSRLRYNLMRYDIPAGNPLFQEIADACQTIVQKHPQIAAAKIVLGYALTKLGKVAEAADCFSKVGDSITRQALSKQAASDSSPADKNQNAQPPVPLSSQRHSPDFMIVGAEKCGTTSLYQYLKQHPDVLPSIEKEIDFFDMEYKQGVDWYLSHFPAAPDRSGPEAASGPAGKRWITGETSANYLYDDNAPARVFKHFPQIKLAVIIRHPIDRTLSRYSMMVRNGAEQRSFETAVTEEIALIEKATTADGHIPWRVLNRCRHVGNSLYYYHIKRWLDIFDQQQLLVLQSETLFSQPAETLSKLYNRLGISQYPEQTYSKYNVGSYQPLEGDIRKTLSDFFAPHTQKLETLLGQSFDWDATES